MLITIFMTFVAVFFILYKKYEYPQILQFLIKMIIIFFIKIKKIGSNKETLP